MKHFLFLIGIALIVTSCNQNKTSSFSQSKDSSISRRTAPVPATAAEWTLNGFTKADAGVMVKAFLTNKGVYNRAARTNIWFPKVYLDKLITMLDRERADGIRIYFAKEQLNKYGFILVSTRAEPNDNTKHQDYFDHNDSYFNSDSSKGVIDRHGSHGNHPGAFLYDDNYKCKGEECIPTSKHYIDCVSAAEWARNHIPHDMDLKKDTINTTSEWFELKLLKAIQENLIQTATAHPNRKPDGIRIYYARKNRPEVDSPHLFRHNLIIVTTEIINGKQKRDYFDCPNKITKADDNGEQCRNQCDGTTWADVASKD